MRRNKQINVMYYNSPKFSKLKPLIHFIPKVLTLTLNAFHINNDKRWFPVDYLPLTLLEIQ